MGIEDESDEELIDVPYEVEVEEMIPQEVMKEEVVEQKIPQVKAMYPYKGNGMDIKKGEVMLLLQKTNNDWWSARQATGQEGYVPATYVREIEPRTISRVVKKPETVMKKALVKKTQYRKEKPVKDK